MRLPSRARLHGKRGELSNASFVYFVQILVHRQRCTVCHQHPCPPTHPPAFPTPTPTPIPRPPPPLSSQVHVRKDTMEELLKVYRAHCLRCAERAKQWGKAEAAASDKAKGKAGEEGRGPLHCWWLEASGALCAALTGDRKSADEAGLPVNGRKLQGCCHLHPHCDFTALCL